MRNSDQFYLEHNSFRVTDANAIAVKLIQSDPDDITTGIIHGGLIDCTGTNGIGLQLFGVDQGNGINEFNCISIQGLKIDGNNVSGTTGLHLPVGCRNLRLVNVEIKECRAYSIDASTSFLNNQKLYIRIESCKILGHTSNFPTAHLFLGSAGASKTNTFVTIANTQLHRATNGVLVSAGSPVIELQGIECWNMTNLLQSSSTSVSPAFIIGFNALSSISNNRGSTLVSSSATYYSDAGRAAGSWTS
jgi:hypothetical protein